MNNTDQQSSTRGGVQSVDVAMTILKSLVARGSVTSLNELSDRTQIHPSKVHRYLTSLVNSGMVEKTAHGQYDLGSYILELSTRYLSRLDPTSIANQTMENLRTRTDEGIILNVWGSLGSTVIRWSQSRHSISVSIRPGSTFMTTMSASGRLFLAYLPRESTQEFVEQEIRQLNAKNNPLSPKNRDDIEAIITETRQHKLARVDGHSVQGISALAAPIFDYRGEISLTIALFGFSSSFDASWDGRNARLLTEAANDISNRLGYIADS